ncbi:hypothetical protein AUEXF2481DRAFT_463584 [Aureobasidium subglaciale EXF-2481]|uniref:Uncharacterized protein n=1 Tax=Aureobasidium subglaciale (strain EXF-2481) TaxID=1043005 RepID=A0A074Y100_AURSE|nr:uncharacterized protein AUEXF2481DRAFT_463584 [Aureobasidium subglaciale EXF-2481]KAI5202977.1 hypothetical protein E4T38_05389 [Aureobasidium subglaciale]KAI5221787.1 hypothetical protein E4T40_05322 [Aureobasidium subglaciale]KAI5225796.1 hypothetical protein E4T41_05141 [Aureobasidium subglaciale]KAI5261633.1 hypothetical protein E4T46_05033 [Aureobasidium subglaciale]KEQ91410.1 hypothetical protein AUEXF2481DRAFT_463584 [Aureobasidium subglaciale EXF-2481]
MSKRPGIDDIAGAPSPIKKTRLNLDAGISEVKKTATTLLDALKSQKSTLQWGHTIRREEIMHHIAKAEAMVTSTAALEKSIKTANHTVDGFINATILAEAQHWFEVFEKQSHKRRDLGDDSGSDLCDWIEVKRRDIEEGVVDIVSEKVQGALSKEIPAKIGAETKAAFRLVVNRNMLAIVDEVMDGAHT